MSARGTVLTLRALASPVRVAADDPTVAGHLARLFRHLRTGSDADDDNDGAGRGVSFVVHGSLSDPPGVSVWCDGEPLTAHRSLPALRALIRAIDEHVIADSPRLLVHAGAVAHGGRALVVPARSGGGKSTLVAGLVRAGCSYLTDEFASPDWETGVIAPYPRALSIDEGSWPALADLAPTVPDGLAPLLAGQWQIDPDDIRPGAVAEPCRVGTVVFPRYSPGSATLLEPIQRVDALRAMIDCTFHFHRHGGRALHVLGDVVAASDCFRLTYGDLDAACRAVAAALGLEPAAGKAG